MKNFCEDLFFFFFFFFGDRLKNFCEDLFFFFFGEHLRFVSLVLGLGLEHSCPWPRECLSLERLSLALALASDFFCVLGLGLGLEPCVLDSTSATVLMGDFNAHVGTDTGTWKGVIGKHGVTGLNENGRYLLQPCCSNGLRIMNTFFQHREAHK